MLAALQLHPRADHQRHRRTVHGDVFLRLAAGALLAALLVAGCGGGDGGEGGGGRQVVAALGDSITAGNPGYDPDPAARESFDLGDDPRSQWEYWAERKHPDMEIRNCGVRGERTDEIARRFDRCVAGADAVVIQGGINDLAQGVPVEAVAANLRALVEAAKEENLDVALADLLPYNPGHPQEDRVVERLNRQIESIGLAERVEVLPFHESLENPANPGTMRPAWTADGIHPSVEGYRRLGELAFQPPGE